MTIENFEKANEMRQRIDSLEKNIKKLTSMLHDGATHFVVIYSAESGEFEIDGELANELLKEQIDKFKGLKMATEKAFEEL